MSGDQMPSAPEKTKLIKLPPFRAGKGVRCPGYAWGGWMLKLRFDWYITLEIWHENKTTTTTVEQTSIYNVNSPVSYSRPHWGELLQIHQNEAMVGRNASTRALEMAKHYFCALLHK